MARGITGPIRALAEGTERVARGDLEVEVEASSDDEIGLPGALVQPDDERPEPGPDRPRAHQRRARAAAALHGDRASQRRRRRGVPGRRGPDRHDQPLGPAAARRGARDPGGGQQARGGDRPPRAARGARRTHRADPRRPARERAAAGAAAERRGHPHPGRHALASPGRGGPRARLGGGVRRLHPGGARPAHGRLARGGASHRPRDQEPAHAHPALRPAHPPTLPGDASPRRTTRRSSTRPSTPSPATSTD